VIFSKKKKSDELETRIAWWSNETEIRWRLSFVLSVRTTMSVKFTRNCLFLYDETRMQQLW